MNDKVICPFCHGYGKISNEEGTKDCSYCKGTGKVDADDPLTGPGGA